MSYIRQWWPVGIGIVLAVVLFGAALTGGLPDDSGVSDDLRQRVDTMGSDRSCASLQALFDQRSDADELSYIDDAMRSAGCYD